jgi:transcriptional antiterminator RfaH
MRYNHVVNGTEHVFFSDFCMPVLASMFLESEVKISMQYITTSKERAEGSAMEVAWYALHSKPRKEEFLLRQLTSNGIEAYCPFVRVATVNPRARQIKPYFPGYVFVHVDLGVHNASTFRWMPGSTGLVGFDGLPAQVPEILLRAIRQRMDRVDLAGGELFHGLNAGDTVQVTEGPFAGYEAIFDARLSGSERVRVLLKLLQRRQMMVELPAAQIQRKKSPLKPGQ